MFSFFLFFFYYDKKTNCTYECNYVKGHCVRLCFCKGAQFLKIDLNLLCKR